MRPFNQVEQNIELINRIKKVVKNKRTDWTIYQIVKISFKDYKRLSFIAYLTVNEYGLALQAIERGYSYDVIETTFGHLIGLLCLIEDYSYGNEF